MGTPTKKTAAKKTAAKKATAPKTDAVDPLDAIREDTPNPELTDLDRDPASVCGRCGRDAVTEGPDGRLYCAKHAARAGIE